ncbi:beta-galactosidase [Paenibacillus sp. FSL R10-2734]|uniref:beta-galactosidase n=1 Tax=Paenibacillus sp. FSL R10-2734 TaxID=2954691 RepID=UPI0030D8FF6A
MANKYEISIPTQETKILQGHLHMGEVNPDGLEINVNSLYFTKGNKPWLPVMGEIHYSRYSAAHWEEAILKMKACQIDIIASYMFWNHIEEIEGQFDWTGNNNIRQFVEICREKGVYVFLRIGPWAHGEARNGGFPDWLMKKECKKRSNDPEYLYYARRFYQQLAMQTKGLWFKDGGPIVGIQLDNELTHDGEHLRTLKKMAAEEGMSAPIYTVTGWGGEGNAEIPQDEVIPMFGGYPAHPWDQNTREPSLGMHYCFYHTRNDAQILPEYLYESAPSGKSVDSYDISRYPYATCELGGGNQMSDHRRLVIEGDDIGAISLCKLGNGNNLLGYYMFHGGSHPIGKLTTFNETRDSGYPNDIPTVSYDFLAPLSEYGKVRESYQLLKRLHLFIQDFGGELATMPSYLPEAQPSSPGDTDTLRYCVRSNGHSGYVFLNNYQRHLTLADQEDVSLHIRLQDETISYPAFDLNNGEYRIWPFNIDLHGVLLKCATAELLCKLDVSEKETTYIFFGGEGHGAATYVIEPDKIAIYSAPNESVVHAEEGLTFTVDRPGLDSIISLVLYNGTRVNIITLTAYQSRHCFKGVAWGSEHIVISSADITFDQDQIKVMSKESPAMDIKVYPVMSHEVYIGETLLDAKAQGVFSCYSYEIPKGYNKVTFQQVSSFRDAQPITGLLVAQDQHRNYVHMRKTFDYESGSPIKSAFLSFCLEGSITIWVNGVKVYSSSCSGEKLSVNVRPYVQEGNNVIAVRYRGKGNSGWIGRLEIESMNSDRFHISTDSTWQINNREIDSWNNVDFDHSSWDYAVAVTNSEDNVLENCNHIRRDEPAIWNIQLEADLQDHLHDLMLEIDYEGDKGQLRWNDRLIADNFYNCQTWQIGLSQWLPEILDLSLELTILPLHEDSYAYFDQKPKFEEEVLRNVSTVRLIPEFSFVVHDKNPETSRIKKV